MVSEKKIFISFSYYKSMGANNPPGHGQLGPQGLDWKDLCRGPLNLATSKYISCGPHGFRVEDFLSFSHYNSMGANEPQGMANLDPGAWSAGFM